MEQLLLKDRALAATAEGITIADALAKDRPLIYVNEGFERLTGYEISLPRHSVQTADSSKAKGQAASPSAR